MAANLAEISYERGESEGPHLYLVEPEKPEVYLVGEAEYDQFTRARFNRWLGSLAIAESVETTETEDKDTNLLEMISAANTGSKEALEMVGMNVTTAVIEACFKDGHITEVTLDRKESGEHMQHGQTMLSVHKNALTLREGRHPVLREITEIEALNGHRIQDADKAGMLKDNYFVVVSIVPEEVPEDKLNHKGDGYFVDSMTLVAQLTYEDENGQPTTQSVFLRGVEETEGGTFEDNLENRYDIAALGQVYRDFRKEAPRTAAGFLNNGLYIPKELLPNGGVDFMRRFEKAADVVTGSQISRPEEEYQKVLEESKKREDSIKSTSQKVLRELLAHEKELKSPMEAVKLMWRLVKKHTVNDSVKNKYIDPIVFGRAAAGYIVKVREAITSGAEARVIEGLMQKAHELAVVSGCGGGADDSKGTNKNSGEAEITDQFGSLTFRCQNGHVNTRGYGELKDTCSVCNISVSCGTNEE